MSCKCAKYEEDENRYYCDVSGSGCMFMSPDSKRCAEVYGEGPDVEERETYTTDQAAILALKWCEKHQGWKRICDIEDSDSLYKTWDDLSEKVRESWIEEYGKYSAESAWREFGHRPCKVPYGFITGKGEFYKDVLKVPRLHNLMMIFKIS